MSLSMTQLRLHLGILSAAVLVGGGESLAGDLVFSYDFEDGQTQVDRIVGGFASTVETAAGEGVDGSTALQVTEGVGTLELFWDLFPDASALTGEVLHISYDHRMQAGGFSIPYLLPNYGDATTAGTAQYRQYTAIGHRPRNSGDDVSYETRFGVNLGKANITDPNDAIPNDGMFHRIDIYLPLFDIPNNGLSGFGRVQTSDQQAIRGANNFFTVNAPGGSYTERQISSLQWFSSGFGFGLDTYLDNLQVQTLNVSDIDAVLADVNGSPTNLASDFTYDFAAPSPNGVVDTDDRDRFIEEIMLSFLGDYNLDRQVDLADLQTLADSFNQNVGSYGDGDTNGDGFVDEDDIFLIGRNWHRDNDTDTPVTGPTDFAEALQLLGLPAVFLGVPGDYNDNGQVEQGDLDLVLQNWGVDTTANGIPDGWDFDLPDGQIDQAELDGVLQNWGGTAAPDFAAAPLPEPAVLAPLMAAVAWTRRARNA